jgi:hypothetical protein
MQMTRLAKLILPHPEHFQLDASTWRDLISGGLVAGSTAFAMVFFGTKVGHVLGEGFGGGGEGC